MEPIIKLEHLTMVYDLGKSNETTAVKDASFEIYPGEYVIFFGASGCGKSSLLYAIAGLEAPAKGDVYIKGINLSRISPDALVEFYRKTIGMVFQAYHLIPQLSARDNILLPQLFLNSLPKDRDPRADKVIERFGIGPFQDRRPSRMSGGQQQRTAIARSLVNDPDIILADEPVGNLDSKNAQIVLDLLLDINQKEKKTVIYVTHNPRDLHYAHRVFHMNDGVIERVTHNPRRSLSDTGVSSVHAGGGNDFEFLEEKYPYLSEFRLQAKLLLNHFCAPYDIHTEEKIETAIERYLEGELNEESFLSFLSDHKDGAGLYTQKSQDLTKRVSKLIEEIHAVRREEGKVAEVEQEATRIRRYLLDEYVGTLSFEQVDRLGHFIRERIGGSLQGEDFSMVLDKPFSEGGVGLNKRTALRFAREVDLILISKTQPV